MNKCGEEGIENMMKCKICGEKVQDNECSMIKHLSWEHEKAYQRIWNLLSENFGEC